MSARALQAKQFTVASANRTLPLVKAIVADIVELYKDVRDRELRLQDLRRNHKRRNKASTDMYTEEVEQIQADLEKDMERLKGFVGELEQLGVEFKDYDQGLVDFPTTINGREAFLCWKLGEDSVEFWHTVDSGFQGRERLPDLDVPPVGSTN